ncbi:hypothetical protein C8Q74DRAFT_46713 [Fomes fomentarius]|nr:hypothetical protein C8Q74DRAFT_46713 [Fomes fomentarius]
MRGQRRPTEVACRRCNKKKVRCDAVMGSARCKKCTDERAECTWPTAAGNAQVAAGRVQVKNACDACRRNKSRCERDEGQETAACVRCTEENRECMFSPRVRGSRSKQLVQDNTQNTAPSMQPILGQTPAGVDNMGSSTMSESYPVGRNGYHQRAPMGNDSGYQSLTSGLRRAQDHLRSGLRMVAVMARRPSKRQDRCLQGPLLDTDPMA